MSPRPATHMEKRIFTVILTKDEEKIAQLLTRDAWVYFSNMISNREIFHVKDIPMMPRNGNFNISVDEELIQYYLNFAGAYSKELQTLGWEDSRSRSAAEAFCAKLEDVSGQIRGSRESLAGFGG